jgi:hypothetical protein
MVVCGFYCQSPISCRFGSSGADFYTARGHKLTFWKGVRRMHKKAILTSPESRVYDRVEYKLLAKESLI